MSRQGMRPHADARGTLFLPSNKQFTIESTNVNPIQAPLTGLGVSRPGERFTNPIWSVELVPQIWAEGGTKKNRPLLEERVMKAPLALPPPVTSTKQPTATLQRTMATICTLLTWLSNS